MSVNQNFVNKTLDFISSHGYQTSGYKFLKDISKFVSELLNVNYVLINKYSDDTPQLAEAIVLYNKGIYKPQFSYNLSNSPCKNVINKDLCHYTSNLQHQFPQDHFLDC